MKRVVDELGRVTLPKEEREKLGIKAGDTLEITTDKNMIILVKE